MMNTGCDIKTAGLSGIEQFVEENYFKWFLSAVFYE